MNRKFISIFLAGVMAVTAMGLPAFAIENTADDAEIASEEVELSGQTEFSDTEAEEEVTSEPTAEPDEAETAGEEVVMLAEGDLTPIDLSAGDAEITAEISAAANGKFIASGTCTNVIIVKSGVTCEITLDSLNISSAKSPIKIESGANVTLHLSGSSNLSSTAKGVACIEVCAESLMEYSTLTIDGEGSLKAECTATHGAAIGTSSSVSAAGLNGRIIINGGNITAIAKGGAAIGTGASQIKAITGCAIEINGGIINATNTTSGSAIGGGYGVRNTVERITINGGTIKAIGYVSGIGAGGVNKLETPVIINGGTISASYTKSNPSNKPIWTGSTALPIVDKNGNELELFTLTMPNGASDSAMQNKELIYNSNSVYTDEEGKLYFYMPQTIGEIAINDTEGTTYYVPAESFNPAEIKEYELVEYKGEPCSCNDSNISFGINITDEFPVYVPGRGETVPLGIIFNKDENCAFPLHNINAQYSLTIDGEPAASDLASINDNLLTVQYEAMGKTLNIEAAVTFKDKTYTVKKDVEVVKNAALKFDLASGSVIVRQSSEDENILEITHGSTVYKTLKATPPEKTKIDIYQTRSDVTTTSNIIEIRADAAIELNKVNIKTILDYPIYIGDGVDASITLKGNNTIYSQNSAAVGGIKASSKLTIDGDGELDITSGSGAGIGNVQKLTINGGTIRATGGAGGAGIGGGNDGTGITVEINDGRVYAYGDGSASGIGGGASATAGRGGEFIMNGGFVEAHGGNSDIGCGGNKNFPGTVVVNGGNIHANLSSVPKSGTQNMNFVIITMQGITDQQHVTYSIDDDNSNPIPTYTDEQGRIYTYMLPGRHWIRVYKDDNTYYRYMDFIAKDANPEDDGDKTNKAHCVLNTTAKLNTFEIPGQIEDAVIDQEAKTVKAKVPNNIMLNRVTPLTTYDGSEATKGALNFDNESHTATYTVYSDDKYSSKEYTVTLELVEQSDPDSADVFDIAKGSVVVSSSFVNYGGTYYKPNPNGYIITGTSNQNAVTIDYDGISVDNIPPVTLRNLNINVNATPLRVFVNADIIIEGSCNLTSKTSDGLLFSNVYGYGVVDIELHVRPSDKEGSINKLNVSGMRIPEEGTKATITGVITNISKAKDRQNGISGSGEFITDSDTVMHIESSDTPEIQVKNSEGTPLYQLTAKIDAEDKSTTTCTYNEKSYYVGDDATLYLMLPDSAEEYTMEVDYDGDKYENKVKIEGAPFEVTLETIAVKSVEYDNSQLEYTGGTVDFTVTGTMLDGNVKIRLKTEGKDPIDADVIKEDGAYKAHVTIPENDSPDNPAVYTVYYVLKGEEKPLPDKISVKLNNTVCKIEAFEMKDQNENNKATVTNIDENGRHTGRISVYMPYDTEFNTHDYFTASKIDIKGFSVTPAVNVPAYFTLDISGRYSRCDYTVTAKDEVTRRVYEVRLYKDPTPTITNLSFTNLQSSDGGKVTVVATGVSTNSINKAKLEKNRQVTIYSDDESIEPVVAQMRMNNGVAEYVAELEFPENTSDTQSASYTLKAKIGDTEQSVSDTVIVPRRERTAVDIVDFVLTGQVGNAVIGKNDISITMPYDADLSEVYPNITLQDAFASYEPLGGQDFTSDKKYTVIAEDGKTTKEYTVHVTKEEEPVVTSIEFENPRYSGAGRIKVKINGEHLENAANAMNVPAYIRVEGKLTSGNNINAAIIAGNAAVDKDGNYVATITVPPNDNDAERKYDLTVTVGNTLQTLTGNVTLTVPAREPDAKELTDIVLAEGQSDVTISDDDVYLYVPYNTNLWNIEPKVYFSGDYYTPAGPQNFNEAVSYKIFALNGDWREYRIHAQRNGGAGIDLVTMNVPQNYKDTEISVDIKGRFIPYFTEGVVKDVMKVTVVPRDGSAVIEDVELTYDENFYGGHASCKFTLPVNEDAADKFYDLQIVINNIEQPLGISGLITVPGRKACSITDFRVNGQRNTTKIIEDDVNGSRIIFKMPYNTDLTHITPVIEINGDSYNPEGEQDFDKKPVVYTVYAAGDTRKYTVTAERDGSPSLNSVTVTNEPTTFNGSTIDVALEGIFFYKAAVKVRCEDGTYLDDSAVSVTMNEWHKANAQITLPENTDTSDDKEYTLEFYLDDFETPISYSYDVKVTVPHKKTKAITYYLVSNQVGSTIIQENDIYVRVQYDADIKSVTTTNIIVDGDAYTTEEISSDGQTRLIKYKVTANGDDEPREYTVHISRDGLPEISHLRYTAPINYRGGDVSVGIDGTFFTSMEVYAVPESGGGEIPAKVTFNVGTATAVVTLPENNSGDQKKYRLKFIVDGKLVSYRNGSAEIIVPRRTAREITEFALPDDIQEGDTIIQGTDIYINVPYMLDISSVVPKTVTYDAHTIEPTVDVPQNFGDSDNPVEYKLSSSGDTDVTYKVHVTRVGQDPYLKSFTVDKQVKETEYEGDNISLTLKSNAKLKEIEPVIDFEGSDYSPKGPQDFSKSKRDPLVYTIVNKYGIEHKYYVSIDKKSSGTSVDREPIMPSPTPSPAPTETPEITPTPTQTPDLRPTEQPKTKAYISGYKTENELLFRPNNGISRAEVAVILCRLDDSFDANTIYPNMFPDINDGAWYKNYMNYAAANGYISGFEDGTSRPEAAITRAQLVSMLARYMGIEPSEAEDRFSDIAPVDWCRGHINALAEKNIVSGYENGAFMPYHAVTRAETVSMINRMLGREMTEETAQMLTCPFGDVFASHWAYNDVLLASCEY